MKKIFFLLFLLSTSVAFAQTEKPINKAIADLFEQKYNAGENDTIFAMFNSEMQTALPIEKTRAFLTSLKSQAGKIMKREFTGYESGPYAAYKATFEKAVLTLRIAVDANGKISGLYAGPYIDHSIPKPIRNTTQLSLPFTGEWTVVWGGDTKELNYHVESVAQKNAFDIVITDATGSSHTGNGQRNEDYYAFGKELFAPCDGEVVLAVDGVKDNVPGKLNPIYIPGNTVIIKTANNEYAFFAHFKQHSIVVKEGQQVKRGELLGLCGNSGNSSEPHLHFHLQNTEDMTTATGIKSYFDKIIVNGQPKNDYSPVKKDKIRNQ